MEHTLLIYPINTPYQHTLSIHPINTSRQHTHQFSLSTHSSILPINTLINSLYQHTSYQVADMETLKGTYDTVTCIDVFIHYPTDAMYGIVGEISMLMSCVVLIM